jgi:hypothetical protein
MMLKNYGTRDRCHKSDISKVFGMDDILVLSEAITALSDGDLKKKMGILSSAPSSVFLSNTALLGHGIYAWLLYEYLKIR